MYTNFDIHPTTGDLLIKTNEDAVKQSIRNILDTNKYERLFKPTFGGSINRFLFEPADGITENLLRDAIRQSIENYEPRANLLDIIVASDQQKKSFNVTIRFTTINIQEPITLTVILERVR